MRTFILLNNEKKRGIPNEFRADDNRNPEELVELFIKEFTKEGDIVLDPFAGLGTTLFVAEELKRIPYGIEYDKRRADYIKSQLKKGKVINGNSLKISSFKLPKIDFCFTSPPYMAIRDKENALSAYTKQGTYKNYLKDMKKFFEQVAKNLKPEGHIVIEVSNLKGNELTTLAWDIQRKLAKIKSLSFEGEVVVGWEGNSSYTQNGTYGYGYDHSYCLVFKKIGVMK